MSQHRKKTVTRSLDSIPKGGIKIVPSRTGKNYFLKYLIESSAIKAQIAKRMEGQANQARPIHVDNVESSTSAIPEKILEESMTTESPIEATYIEMIVVLLSQVYKSMEIDKSVAKLLSSFLLSDIVADYKQVFADTTLPISSYTALENLLKKLRTENSMFARGKHLDIATLHRLLSFRLEVWCRAQGDKIKKKKKIHTQSRVERLVYVWKKVKQFKKISMIDLSNLISTDLEKDMPFKIDKKTIIKLVTDLEKLMVVNITKFMITIESQKILDNQNTFYRNMVSDAFLQMSDQVIGDDPCIKNPTFKRDAALPVSLEFLVTEGERLQRKRQVLTSKKSSVLESIYLEEIKKGEINPRDRAEIQRSEKLTRIAKLIENRQIMIGFTAMKAHFNVSMVSKLCAELQISHSVTDRFLQNKLEVAEDLNFVSQMLCYSEKEFSHASHKHETLKTDRLVVKTENSVSRFYQSIDQILAKHEDDAIKDVRQGSALALRDSLDQAFSSDRGHSDIKFEDLLADANDCKPSEYLGWLMQDDSIEHCEEIAKVTQKQVEIGLQKILNLLKKDKEVPKEEIMKKLKNSYVAEKVISLLKLQNNIQEVSNLDGDRLQNQTRLKLVK